MAYSGIRPEFLADSDPEHFADQIQIMRGKHIQWEIFYTDGTSVYGTTRAEWALAPSDNVQVVIVQEPSQRIIVISMLDKYLGKQGRWMEDKDFDALLERASQLSRIINGNTTNNS